MGLCRNSMKLAPLRITWHIRIIRHQGDIKQFKLVLHAEYGEVGAPPFPSFHCKLLIFPHVSNLPETKSTCGTNKYIELY